jgi:hypothetical protein
MHRDDDFIKRLPFLRLPLLRLICKSPRTLIYGILFFPVPLVIPCTFERIFERYLSAYNLGGLIPGCNGGLEDGILFFCGICFSPFFPARNEYDPAIYHIPYGESTV